MILIAEGKVRLGEEQTIQGWVVWFHTPWGLCKTCEEAIEACLKAELDPDSAIVPVPVAIGETIYEAFVRG